MKIRALDVKAGDRIVAYCNNKMQICKVKSISNTEQMNITLSVFTSEHYRGCLVSSVVRFRDDALVDLVS
ncbi:MULTISPECIES: hypothetical protein [Nostocaceae]|uniref:hypothetical protein n=1 Tax=Nostocaceae TaxID=1162 RepID=UPI001688BDC7|nr:MULTISPECIES: hypothetical protein [Nostocaceae]MBD2365059.1 hypothetical protein [Anabaena minutissima FACHB-250]MEA5564647.1 hypothetical protein [Anabaena sp. UHCC 0399]UKO96786.1 hypothetical protein L6494_19545 [Nostoc sp. UHCC 0870]